MSQKFGEYHLARYSRLSKRLRPASEENTHQIKESLKHLCDLASGAPFDWFLVGDLGIDMHAGKITRFHHDIVNQLSSSVLVP